jgi:uncharacterized RDD family membrane protein YckC
MPPPPPPSYGTPPPPGGYATPPQYGAYPPGAAPGGWTGPPLAEWPQRALSALIDWFGPFLVAGIVSRISFVLGALLELAALAWALYNGYLQGQTGQSFGKKQAGTRLVSETNGQVIGGGMGVVRQIAHFVDGIICYLGFLLPLIDKKKQTIADKIMKTVVITA